MDFFDRIKSVSRGYASMDYAFERFEASRLVRVDVLINGDKVDALAIICHADQAMYRGRALTERMKHRVDDSRRGTDRAGFTTALNAKFVMRAKRRIRLNDSFRKCF